MNGFERVGHHRTAAGRGKGIIWISESRHEWRAGSIAGSAMASCLVLVSGHYPQVVALGRQSERSLLISRFDESSNAGSSPALVSFNAPKT